MIKKCYCFIVILCILLLFGCSKSKNIDLNISNKEIYETITERLVLDETFNIKNNYDINKNMFLIEYYNIKDEEEIDGKKVLFQEARYPQISVAYDNEQLSNYLMELNNNFKKSADNFIIENKQDSRFTLEFIKIYKGSYFEYNETISIESLNDSVLSILSNYYEDTKGPHGYTILTGYNYDIINGKEISINELISDKTKLKQLIVNCLENDYEVKEALYYDYQDKIDGFLNGEYEMNFLVTDNGIDILFNEYDLAPYYAGDIIVPINYVGNEDVFSDNLW